MTMIGLLSTVIYNSEARDGTWCKLPYPGHPKGCPNFPQCPNERENFQLMKTSRNYEWYAVMEEFDLKTHAEIMRKYHPSWTDRQCRNLLYWQGRIRKKLKDRIRYICRTGDVVLDIPEACGINVFETMALVGVQIDRHPNIVRKVMMIGKIIK